MLHVVITASALAWSVPNFRGAAKPAAAVSDSDYKASLIELGMVRQLHIPAVNTERWKLIDTGDLHEHQAWHEMGAVRELLVRSHQPSRTVEVGDLPRTEPLAVKPQFPDLSETERVLTTPYPEAAPEPELSRARRARRGLFG